MKKLFILPLLVMLAMIVSCSDENDAPDLPEVKNELFSGKLLFNGTVVSDKAECALFTVEETATVTLYDVTFAPTMPAMDIVFPALTCKRNGDNCVVSGKNIVPTVNGEPETMFMVAAVEGSLEDGEFVFTAETPMGTIGFSNALLNIKPAGGESKSYKGSLLVGDFTKEAVVKVTKNEVEGSLDLVIEGAKFAANMPLELDITLKGIPCLVNDGVLYFSAENVAPYINTENEPVPAYMFAGVNGTVQGSKLLFDAKMAENLAAYVAGKEFVFEGTETVG